MHANLSLEALKEAICVLMCVSYAHRVHGSCLWMRRKSRETCIILPSYAYILIHTVHTVCLGDLEQFPYGVRTFVAGLRTDCIRKQRREMWMVT